MKSFNQFLQESYLSEERPAKKRKAGGPTVDELKAKIYAKDDAKEARAAQRGTTGAAADSSTQFRPQGANNTVSGSNLRGETSGRSPKPYSGTTSPSARVEPAGSGNSQQTPEKSAPSRTPADLQNTLADRRAKRAAEQAAKTAKGGELALRPQSSSSAAKTATKTAGKGILKTLGKIAGPASAALDVADERSKGSGWARSLAKGAVVAAGGALGGAAGTVAGPVGNVAGAVGGSMAASKAFDTVAGANAKERKGIATANRKSQAGSAIKGVGGKTSFDTKKNTITSGGKTAQLGKTSVITGPGGKQEVGNLAYKGGKAVYKRSDTKSLAQTSSNPLERVGRSLFAGAYKKSDAANAAKKLATARQSDAARNKALGVKFGPGK